MPPFNPALIGAPSPVGRGGGGADALIGSVLFSPVDMGPKYSRCRGAFSALTDAQIAVLGLEAHTQTFGDPSIISLSASVSLSAVRGAHGNGTHVFTTDTGNGSGNLITSTDDGVNWTSVTPHFPSQFQQQQIIFAAGYFYYLTNNGLYISQNGRTWWVPLDPPSGLAKANCIWAGDGVCCMWHTGSNAIFTHTVAGGYVQKNYPTGYGNLYTDVPPVFIPELGAYYLRAPRNSDGLSVIIRSQDLLFYTSVIQYPLGVSAYAFGSLILTNGAQIEFRDPNTGVTTAPNINSSAGQINSVAVANGLLLLAGSSRLLEINNNLAVTAAGNTTSSGYGYLSCSGKGYVVGTSTPSMNVYRAASREPNGLWLPNLPSRKNRKGQILDAYMRIAA